MCGCICIIGTLYLRMCMASNACACCTGKNAVWDRPSYYGPIKTYSQPEGRGRDEAIQYNTMPISLLLLYVIITFLMARYVWLVNHHRKPLPALQDIPSFSALNCCLLEALNSVNLSCTIQAGLAVYSSYGNCNGISFLFWW